MVVQIFPLTHGVDITVIGQGVEERLKVFEFRKFFVGEPINVWQSELRWTLKVQEKANEIVRMMSTTARAAPNVRIMSRSTSRFQTRLK